jgi:hypothetical protein
MDQFMDAFPPAERPDALWSESGLPGALAGRSGVPSPPSQVPPFTSAATTAAAVLSRSGRHRDAPPIIGRSQPSGVRYGAPGAMHRPGRMARAWTPSCPAAPPPACRRGRGRASAMERLKCSGGSSSTPSPCCSPPACCWSSRSRWRSGRELAGASKRTQTMGQGIDVQDWRRRHPAGATEGRDFSRSWRAPQFFWAETMLLSSLNLWRAAAVMWSGMVLVVSGEIGRPSAEQLAPGPARAAALASSGSKP